MHNPYDDLSEDEFKEKFNQLQSQIGAQTPMQKDHYNSINKMPVETKNMQQESTNPYDKLSPEEFLKEYEKINHLNGAFDPHFAQNAMDPKYNRYVAQSIKNLGTGLIDPTGYLADKIDDWTGGYTKANTTGEKMAESALQGVGNMLPSKIISKGIIKGAGKALKYSKDVPGILSKGIGYVGKGAEKVGKFLGLGNEFTASNIAANAATNAIVRKELEEGAGPVQSLLMGIVGGNAAGKGVGALAFKGAKKVSDIPKSVMYRALEKSGNLLGINPQKVKTMNKAGFKDSKTVGDVSDYRSTKAYQHILSAFPFLDDAFIKQYNKRPAEFFKTLGIKNPKSQLELGNDTIKKIDDIFAKHKTKTQDLRNKFTNHLTGQNQEVDVSNTLSKFAKMRKNYNNEVGAKFLLDETEAGNFVKKLEDMATNNQIKRNTSLDEYIGYKPPTKKVHFNTMEGLRSKAYDKAAEEFAKYSDIEGGRLKYFGNSLAEDMNNHFKNLNGEAYKNWKNYNDYYSKFSNEATPNLNQLKTKLSEKAISVADTLKGNVKKAGEKPFNILSHIDDPLERREYVSNIFNELATNNKHEISPQTFVENYKKLQPEVKATLLKEYGKDARKIDHLLNAIDLTKSTMKEANFSGSGTHRNLVDAGLKLAGILATGDYLGLGNTLAGYGLAYGLTHKMMANPKFIDAVAYAQTIKNKTQVPFAINKLNEFIPGLKNEYFKQMKEGSTHGRTVKAIAKSTLAIARDKKEKKK